MSVIYTDEYEVRKAYTEIALDEGTFAIEYSITSPIDEKPKNVNAYINIVLDKSTSKRVGYGLFDGGKTSIRFDDAYFLPSVRSQEELSRHFFSDLIEILK